jgi:hypothetical protein
MEIKLLDQKGILSEVEELRNDAFNIDDEFSTDSYKNRFKDHQLLILGAFIDGKLVGALYFSPFFSTNGYIEQLFVRKEFQNCSFHVGTSLLQYLEDNIEDIEDYFKRYFTRLYIEYKNEKSERVYLNAGFRYTKLDGTLTKEIGIK